MFLSEWLHFKETAAAIKTNSEQDKDEPFLTLPREENDLLLSKSIFYWVLSESE